MANWNLVKVTMGTADTVVFRAISVIRDKSKRPDEAKIYNYVKNFPDDSEVSDDSFWKEWKQLRTKELL